MLLLLVSIPMLIVFIFMSRKNSIHDKEKINNEEELFDERDPGIVKVLYAEGGSIDEIADELEMDEERIREIVREADKERDYEDMKQFVESEVDGWKYAPWIGICFFGMFVFIPLVMILSGGLKNDPYLYIPIIFFILFGIGGIIYLLVKRIRINKLYKHFINGTIIVKKAEIIKFGYFHYEDQNTRSERGGYCIVAYDGYHKFKSKKVEDYTGFCTSIDKNYYQKKGIPFGPKDPNFNENFKKQANLKKKDIDHEIRDLSLKLKNTSGYEKRKIEKEIGNLEKEKSGLLPYVVYYQGKIYYIGDEITVYIDPDNPRNYIM